MCPRCSGIGQVIARPVPDCRGEGVRIEERTYTVDIPAGVDTGSTLRLTGPRRGRAAGRAQRRPLRPRAGAPARPVRPRRHDLHCDAAGARFAQAALGAHLQFETLDGTEDLVVPRGTPTGRELRLRGPGRAPPRAAASRGDLHRARSWSTSPTDLTAEQEELLRQLRRAAGRRRRAGRARLPVADPLGLPVAPVARAIRPTTPARSSSSTTSTRRSCTPTTATTSSGCCACAPGDPLTVGDGRGGWRPARFGAELEPTGPTRAVGRAPARRSRSGFALVKGDKPELVVQKLTELGIDRIIPFRAERSVVRWDEARAAKAVARLRLVARAAAAQCHRPGSPRSPRSSTSPTARPRGGRGRGRPRGRARWARSTPRCWWAPRVAGPPARSRGRSAGASASDRHVLRAETAAIAAGALLADPGR